MNFRFGLFSFLLSFTVFGASPKCFLVSGSNFDKLQNGAFKNAQLIGWGDQESVSDPKCKRFDSYKLLDIFLNKEFVSGKLKKDEQILIVQGAHGSPGGGARCNAGDLSGEEIYGYLKKISSKFQLGVILSSCYSGDLLVHKLKDDRRNPNAKSVTQMCIITASKFGLSTNIESSLSSKPSILHQISVAPAGQSMETLFLQSRAGLISSAAWDRSGVTDYFISKDLSKAAEVIQSMNKLTPNLCPGKESLQICAEPGTDDTSLSVLGNIKSAQIKLISILNLNELKKEIDNSLQIDRGDAFFEKMTNNKECNRALYKSYSDWLGSILNNTNVATISYLEFGQAINNFLNDFSKNKECSFFNGDLRESSWLTIEKYSRKYFAGIILEGYFKSLTAISALTGDADEASKNLFSAIEVMNKTSSRKECGLNVRKGNLLRAILGEELLDRHPLMPQEAKYSDIILEDIEPIHQLHALDAFVRGSLSMSYQNTLDKKRKEACQNFKF